MIFSTNNKYLAAVLLYINWYHYMVHACEPEDPTYITTCKSMFYVCLPKHIRNRGLGTYFRCSAKFPKSNARLHIFHLVQAFFSSWQLSPDVSQVPPFHLQALHVALSLRVVKRALKHQVYDWFSKTERNSRPKCPIYLQVCDATGSRCNAAFDSTRQE